MTCSVGEAIHMSVSVVWCGRGGNNGGYPLEGMGVVGSMNLLHTIKFPKHNCAFQNGI